MQTITITLEGGIIQDIQNIPAGVQVRVLDFDIEGLEEDEIITLPNGEKAHEGIWIGD